MFITPHSSLNIVLKGDACRFPQIYCTPRVQFVLSLSLFLFFFHFVINKTLMLLIFHIEGIIMQQMLCAQVVAVQLTLGNQVHLEPVAVSFVIGCVSFPQSCTLKEAFPNGCNSAGFPSETPPTRSSTITNTKVIRASDEEMTMGCFFFLHFVQVSSSVFIFMSFQFCPLLCSEAHTL